jgi:hypothetical protein
MTSTATVVAAVAVLLEVLAAVAVLVWCVAPVFRQFVALANDVRSQAIRLPIMKSAPITRNGRL